MTMLQILSKNRDLEAQIKEAEHMLTEVDIESMPFFSIGFERGEKKGLEEGLAKGVEKGWEKGMERGMEEGLEKGEAQVVRRLLSRLGVAEVSELLGLSVEAVERIAAAGGNEGPAHGRH